MKTVKVLPLDFQIGDFVTTLNPAVVIGAEGLLLVDVGNPGFLPKLKEAMSREGLSIADVRKVVVTHHDGDHMGALKALVDEYPGIEVLCSEQQAPYVTGREKPLRLKLAEERLKSAPEGPGRRELEEEISRLSGLETVDAVAVVRDGQELFGFGARIVEVSGHMPGHVCVYVEADRALIAGDALTAWDGRLCPPDGRFTLNMEQAKKSLEKLRAFELENVVCYHGGVVSGPVGRWLEEIIRGG